MAADAGVEAVGASGEYALTYNWIVRGEYRYTEFDEKSFVTQPEGVNLYSRRPYARLPYRSRVQILSSL